MFSGSQYDDGLRTSKRDTMRPPRSYWAEIHRVPMQKSRLAGWLGMPQMPLPPFTEISVETGRSNTYCPVPKNFISSAGSRRGAGRAPLVQAMARLYSM